ncbi:uncharacterized protein KQ657_003542 [Scheffersomyces spartinae]|uniref:mRNA stability protein n=1 Tax=Scheffersomyces spartinae TaxID=45513 RepID=A0A9P8AGR0_9ASCO|nr:uncharacterized protein KQ657_003542 [Scheffersomyces spartinae]KAG7191337.1 hypothetical protein KQ657_003542 [Scheffersomyces spartinae]
MSFPGPTSTPNASGGGSSAAAQARRPQSPMSDEDPLLEPKNTQNIDLSKLLPQELRIYRMYGKLPSTQQILSSRFQDKKYFDSGDYAMQKQGNKAAAGGLGGNIGGSSNLPMTHPNAERVKEMYYRNSISSNNAQILFNGKLGLLNESTPNNGGGEEES